MKVSILLFFNKTFPWRSVGLLLGLILINLSVLAQPVSQERFPTYDSQMGNGSGTSVWINANSIYSDNNDCTYNELKEATSNTLNLYDFGFSIPSGATIQGIKVSMGRFGTPGSQVKDAIVRLSLSGISIGENKAVTTETWNEDEIETLKEYGGETDLWGTTLTVEDINYRHLGLDIAVSSVNYGTNIRAYIDYAKITIYYTPLDPSYCAGAAVVLVGSNNTLNADNSVGAPDGEVAKLIDLYSNILLDLTGEVTPRPQGGKVKVRLRDPNPDDGASPWLYYRYATTRSESGFNWSTANVYQINSTTLVDAEIPVGENTRYLMLEVAAYFNLAIEIDAVTYDCPCSGATITSVTANPTVICNGTPTTLSVTGDLCGADHWAWYQYGCGQTLIGTGQTLNYTPYPGTRTFYVRAEGGSAGTGGACGSVTVTVNEWPMASITGGEQNACVSTTLTATTNITSASYAWYKDDVLLDGQTAQTLLVTQTGSYKVKVTNTATGCERTSYAFTVNSISTMPANKTVFADPSTVCPGTRVNIGIRSSESGVYYRLRNDADDSYIGEAVLGLNGVTIYLLAGNLTETMTFNVIAMKGYCVLEMADKPTVTVLSGEPAITGVTAVPAAVCQGTSSTLSVTGELGSATAWKWYSGSCGGTLVGTGESITVSPTEATTYYVRGEGGCATPGAVCSEVTVAVNPSVTPSVTISSNDADNTICYGTEVIFTATPGDTGGGTVSYKWILNGTVYDVWDKDTWVSTELEDGNQVSCQMTVTGGSCLSQSTVVSNIITMDVYDPSPLLSVAITSNDADNEICEGTEVVFKATPANTGGGLVFYQWKYNGDPIGSNSDTYASTELFNGDRVSCEITVSYPGCSPSATVSSDEIITSVITMPTPWVTIQSDDADNTVCSGSSVTFTVTAENTEWGTVNYHWVKNEVPVGLDQNTYVTSDLEDKDEVFCYVSVTGGPCNQTEGSVSNSIVMNVTSPTTPTVSIVSSDADNSICSGTSVTFTATAVDTGQGTVSYQWKVNDSNVGTGENPFTLSTLADADAVSCEITITGGTCLTTPSAMSNVITFTVNQCCTPGQADSFEPNNILADAALVKVDAPEISANILNSKDVDWFYFTTTMDGYYTINFNANGGKEIVELYNAKEKKLRSGSKTSLVYNLLANTSYYIKIYDSKLKSPSPCYSMSVSYSAIMPAGGYTEQNIDLKVAQMEPIADRIIKIWPNPTNTEFELYNGNEVQVDVRVLDAYSRTIETIENIGVGETVVFGSHYTPGIYFVKTFENGIQRTFILVKQ